MYQIGFSIYVFLFRIVALFHSKAAKMVRGQRKTWKQLKSLDSNQPWLWFHASSLGEFEQGRPVMESIRSQYPDYRILLTFYSPSGYEVQKNYAGADLVCYLPFDTWFNVKRFIKLVQPKRAFFIKYEFWPNYLTQLAKYEIPTYLISGIFRTEQLFFKKYGKSYRGLLNTFNHIFVQNNESLALLRSIGRKKDVTKTGDTRYDRVMQIRNQAKDIPEIEAFRNHHADSVVLIAGSSWPKDEEHIISYFNQNPTLKLILAPHQIDNVHLQWIENKLGRPHLRLSKANAETVKNCDCILIDCFGLLSSIYRFGDMAYIGGGFGNGIHNTLEAVVYGIPVIFGPNYKRFQEAKDLLACGGAKTIATPEEFNKIIDLWINDIETRKEAGKKAFELVEQNSGGTQLVLLTVPL